VLALICSSKVLALICSSKVPASTRLQKDSIKSFTSSQLTWCKHLTFAVRTRRLSDSLVLYIIKALIQSLRINVVIA